MAALLRDAIHPNLVQTLEGTPALVHGGPVRQHRPRLQLDPRDAHRHALRRHRRHGGGVRLRPRRREVPRHQVRLRRHVALGRRAGRDGARAQDARRRPEGRRSAVEDLAALSRGMPEPRAAPRQRPDLRPARGRRDQPLPDGHAGRDRVSREALRRARRQGRALRSLRARRRRGRGPRPRRPRRDRPGARPGTGRSTPGTGRSPRRSRSSRAGSTAPEASPSPRRPRSASSATKNTVSATCRSVIAKTPYSFSDDPKKGGRPSGFTLHVDKTRLFAGAGFVVAICGDIMTMPGLPKQPAAETDRRRLRRASVPASSDFARAARSDRKYPGPGRRICCRRGQEMCKVR